MTNRRASIPIFVALAMGALPAQSPEGYSQAYNDWVRNSEGLEHDAPTERGKIADRADRAAADAAKFETARKTFFEAQRAQMMGLAGRIEPLALALATPADAGAREYLSTQDGVLSKSVGIFADDTDESIQRLRRALEEERSALAAVRTSLEARETASGALQIANESVDRANQAVADEIKVISDSFDQAAGDAGGLAEAWGVYYKALVNGARGLATADPLPISAARPSASDPARISRPAPVAAAANVTGLPMARYTGGWEYLKGASTSTGQPPASFEMEVKAEGGRISGTVNATFDGRFAGDTAVRFTFTGLLQAGHEQSFPLETPEGDKGKVELIPGGAFNLLQVRFTIDGAAAKIRDSDVVLVKK